MSREATPRTTGRKGAGSRKAYAPVRPAPSGVAAYTSGVADPSRNTPDAEPPPRYLIGIDLGTTNSALAYVDTGDESWAVRDFLVPQLVAPGEVAARDVLPSFHYEAAAGEFPPGALRLPWQERAHGYAVGLFAREHGAQVPGRLVVSAKSWLSHSGVDRTAGLLPWHGAPDVERLSPVKVSARYLAHLRGAWDHRFPEHPMARQEVVLTVPASFDEVARELTVEAAREAGLVKVVLVEEPQAAFYAWIDAHRGDWESHVRPGQTILVCDIGGGTSDFTLIRVEPAEGGRVRFHRVAVGEHLILGGDNLDLALAHHLEPRVAGGGGKLPPRQWGALVRVSRQVKETLLGPDAPERLTVTLPGAGAKLIGGAAQTEVTRAEVRELLVEGFLPRVPLDARPASRRSGFQEFGLPYAPDPAVTKYLCAFLTAHRRAGLGEGGAAAGDSHPAGPDLVLFNGGFFESPVLRDRLLDVLTGWFAAPAVLRNDRLDLAVARGAAYYGAVRRGRGVRIRGGLAHTYYIGVEAGGAGQAKALCLLPAGVEEGHTVDLTGRQFELLIRQPAEFPLFVSSTRTTDKPGELIEADPEQLSALPPIRTVLQSGKKSGGADSVTVTLHARLTEIGTLDIWLAEAGGSRRQWRLQFDVRAATRPEVRRHDAAAEAEGFVDEQAVQQCRNLIRATFRPFDFAQGRRGGDGSTDTPAGLAKRLEEASGMGRNEWPSSFMRALWETLTEVEGGRSLSVDHEARWLSLTGFCLRPGYGLAVDDWRVAQVWRLVPGEVTHSKNEQVRAEWWVLWRRVAGGLSPGQQTTLADPLLAALRTYLRKSGAKIKWQAKTFQFGPHESAEAWRALGAFELLKPAAKAELGNMALDLLPREKGSALRDALLFALGRAGARVPVYGPLNALVPPEQAEAWVRRLMQATAPSSPTDKTLFAAVQLARRTGDRYRDVSDPVRQDVLAWLESRAAPAHFLELVREATGLREEEQRAVFGESLPRGLRIE